MIEINDEFIKIYSKKIMGFAFLKTKKTDLAEDLAQDILFQLIRSIQKNSEIESMDSYVYTLCCYTWSKFLRTHKKHWHNQSLELTDTLVDSVAVDQQVENQLMLEMVKEQIGYLGQLHRKIMMMYYFEQKKAIEIANELKLNPSTVRWYLGEIRKQVKEGIDVRCEHLNYEPKRLECGHDGFVLDSQMAGLSQDLLTQNIAIICYGTPHSLTEISRKLGVGAAYIEGMIERLVEMDYLKVSGIKYQTNFFIDTPHLSLIRAKYEHEQIGVKAQQIKLAVDENFERIKNIGFLGHDIKEDALKWMIIAFLTHQLQLMAREALAVPDYPKRKDGSHHFVRAALKEELDQELKEAFSDQVQLFKTYRQCKGIKSREGKLVHGLQLETWLSIQYDIDWREFEMSRINDLLRVKDLINQDQPLGELDKLLMSELIAEGYLTMYNHKPKLLVPFLTALEYRAFREIIDQMIEQLGRAFFVDYIQNFATLYEAEIPAFLSPELRQYEKYNVFPLCSVFGWLIETKQLNVPLTKEEAQSICTMLWEPSA